MSSAITSVVRRLPDEALVRRSKGKSRRSPVRLQCVHSWIEMQAERTPEAVAVTFGADSLTYSMLNVQANQLARRAPRIWVSAPKSSLGFASAGRRRWWWGFWLCLRREARMCRSTRLIPPERLAFMLEDANVSVLLTQEDVLDRLPPYLGEVICLDRDRPTIALEPSANLSGSGQGLHNLAYVIYTSGSTGRPKGAMIHHLGSRELPELVLASLRCRERAGRTGSFLDLIRPDDHRIARAVDSRPTG